MNEKPNAVQNSSKCSHMFIDEKVMSQWWKSIEREFCIIWKLKETSILLGFVKFYDLML